MQNDLLNSDLQEERISVATDELEEEDNATVDMNKKLNCDLEEGGSFPKMSLYDYMNKQRRDIAAHQYHVFDRAYDLPFYNEEVRREMMFITVTDT